MRKIWLFGVLVCGSAWASSVIEAEKTLPLVQDVDVVVVGGSSGAVAAACKAKAAGAKVFVVAPRPYLGEDMAGKLRLRLEAGDDMRSEIQKEMFVSDARPASLLFTYKADCKADTSHADATGAMLADGKWMDATSESLQFGGDVTVTLDLDCATEIGDFVASVFEREGDGGFCTRRIEVQGSADGKTWKPIGGSQDRASTGTHECVTLTVSVRGSYRYLKVLAKISEGCKRQLLGEFYVYPPKDASAGNKLADQTTSIKVKKALDAALLKAGIPFLTGSLASEPLVDASGKLAGVVIANRNGRQAIRAKVVIDATERGLLARSAGAQATPFPAGTYTFKRVVVAGQAPRAEGVRVKELFGVFNTRVTGIRPPKGMPDTIKGRMFECEIDLPMRDGSARSFAEAEQKARDLTFVPTQLESADTLSLTPPDWIKGQSSSQAPWQGADALDINVFKPLGTDYLLVLSPMADLSREAAEQMMRPGNLMALGERVGAEAARLAAARPVLSEVHVDGRVEPTRKGVLVGEHDQGLPDYLCSTSGMVRAGLRELPVLAECDVVVAGAGTGGGPAGIGAARREDHRVRVHQSDGRRGDGRTHRCLLLGQPRRFHQRD